MRLNPSGSEPIRIVLVPPSITLMRVSKAFEWIALFVYLAIGAYIVGRFREVGFIGLFTGVMVLGLLIRGWQLKHRIDEIRNGTELGEIADVPDDRE